MKNGLIITGLLALVIGLYACVATPVLAQAGPNPNPNGEPITLTNPLCTGGGTCNSDVADLIQSIVKWLFVIATPIAVGMILIGAFQMLFAAGSEDKFATGKRTVLYAVIGYAIILIGWGITSIIQSLLG